MGLKQFIAKKNKDYHPVIAELIKPYINNGTRLLEVGWWDGVSSLYYKQELGLNDIYGIDCFENSVNAAKEKGIKAFLCDLEKDKFPFEDDCFDIVIANQVFEHLKQIYMPLTEIHRIIKPDGYLVFGVPNLASLHNRLLLSIGKQPTCIQMFDEHIRAFTPNTLIEFLTFNNLFQLVRFKGLGFYPLIPPFSDIFSKFFPKASVIMLILLKKNIKQGITGWQKEVQRLVKQTNY